MPASLVPNGRQYFTDINGAPLVAGKVYMYEPLTLIPKDTWQDSGQNTLNTNPVILDSRGQAVIYGSGDYRQILTDSLGNTIWDQEIAAYQETVFGPKTTLASNTTTNLGTATSNNILITGTTTINSFGTAASLNNPVYLIQFSGILTLTYNATSMILPGLANITTAANDCAMVEFINSAGYWRMLAYFPSASSGVLGTASSKNIGTSGGTVPLLNANNTWSGAQSFTGPTYSPEVAFSIIANTITPDLGTGSNFQGIISANVTMNNPVNAQAGQSGVFVIGQSNAGLTITWGTSYKAPGGAANVNLSGVNGAQDLFAYYVRSPTLIIMTPILNPT